jgi:hypothetical protein
MYISIRIVSPRTWEIRIEDNIKSSKQIDCEVPKSRKNKSTLVLFCPHQLNIKEFLVASLEWSGWDVAPQSSTTSTCSFHHMSHIRTYEMKVSAELLNVNVLTPHHNSLGGWNEMKSPSCILIISPSSSFHHPRLLVHTKHTAKTKVQTRENK